MGFIGGSIGFEFIVLFALLIGCYLGVLALQSWALAKGKRRRRKDVALIVYRSGELYSIKYLTIRAAAQAALKSEVSPYCIVSNGETVWQAWEVDNIEQTLEKLAR